MKPCLGAGDVARNAVNPMTNAHELAERLRVMSKTMRDIDDPFYFPGDLEDAADILEQSEESLRQEYERGGTEALSLLGDRKLSVIAKRDARIAELAGRVEELEEIRDAILASTSEQWIHDLYDEERPDDE